MIVRWLVSTLDSAIKILSSTEIDDDFARAGVACWRLFLSALDLCSRTQAIRSLPLSLLRSVSKWYSRFAELKAPDGVRAMRDVVQRLCVDLSDTFRPSLASFPNAIVTVSRSVDGCDEHACACLAALVREYCTRASAALQPRKFFQTVCNMLLFEAMRWLVDEHCTAALRDACSALVRAALFDDAEQQFGDAAVYSAYMHHAPSALANGIALAPLKARRLDLFPALAAECDKSNEHRRIVCRALPALYRLFLRAYTEQRRDVERRAALLSTKAASSSSSIAAFSSARNVGAAVSPPFHMFFECYAILKCGDRLDRLQNDATEQLLAAMIRYDVHSSKSMVSSRRDRVRQAADALCMSALRSVASRHAQHAGCVRQLVELDERLVSREQLRDVWVRLANASDDESAQFAAALVGLYSRLRQLLDLLAVVFEALDARSDDDNDDEFGALVSLAMLEALRVAVEAMPSGQILPCIDAFAQQLGRSDAVAPLLAVVLDALQLPKHVVRGARAAVTERVCAWLARRSPKKSAALVDLARATSSLVDDCDLAIGGGVVPLRAAYFDVLGADRRRGWRLKKLLSALPDSPAVVRAALARLAQLDGARRTGVASADAEGRRLVKCVVDERRLGDARLWPLLVDYVRTWASFADEREHLERFALALLGRLDAGDSDDGVARALVGSAHFYEIEPLRSVFLSALTASLSAAIDDARDTELIARRLTLLAQLPAGYIARASHWGAALECAARAEQCVDVASAPELLRASRQLMARAARDDSCELRTLADLHDGLLESLSTFADVRAQSLTLDVLASVWRRDAEATASRHCASVTRVADRSVLLALVERLARVVRGIESAERVGIALSACIGKLRRGDESLRTDEALCCALSAVLALSGRARQLCAPSVLCAALMHEHDLSSTRVQRAIAERLGERAAAAAGTDDEHHADASLLFDELFDAMERCDDGDRRALLQLSATFGELFASRAGFNALPLLERRLRGGGDAPLRRVHAALCCAAQLVENPAHRKQLNAHASVLITLLTRIACGACDSPPLPRSALWLASERPPLGRLALEILSRIATLSKRFDLSSRQLALMMPAASACFEASSLLDADGARWPGVENFMAAYALLHAMVLRHADAVVHLAPSFLAHARHLLHSLVLGHRALSDRDVALCAENLARLYAAVGQAKLSKQFSKYAVHMLADYIGLEQSIAFAPVLKDRLRHGIMSLMSICSEHEYRHLNQNINHTGRVIFRSLFAQHERTRHKGKV
jgi:Urb2/Npa2 family